MDLIFVTIKNSDNIVIQNKVALKCDTSKEDIQKVAENFFKNVCKMENLSPDFFTYEIFIRNADNFYKIEKEVKRSKKKLENYYDSMGDAINAAIENARDKGYTVADDIEDMINWEPMQPETSQTKLYTLYKCSIQCKKALNITLYTMPSGKFELVTYIN